MLYKSSQCIIIKALIITIIIITTTTIIITIIIILTITTRSMSTKDPCYGTKNTKDKGSWWPSN